MNEILDHQSYVWDLDAVNDVLLSSASKGLSTL